MTSHGQIREPNYARLLAASIHDQSVATIAAGVDDHHRAARGSGFQVGLQLGVRDGGQEIPEAAQRPDLAQNLVPFPGRAPAQFGGILLLPRTVRVGSGCLPSQVRAQRRYRAVEDGADAVRAPGQVAVFISQPSEVTAQVQGLGPQHGTALLQQFHRQSRAAIKDRARAGVSR
jgi:hypothetical protein